MPELSALNRAGLPQIQFNPIVPNLDAPPVLPADTTAASATLGNAAVLNAVSKTISELPDTFTKAYQVGRGTYMQKQGDDAKLRGLQLQQDILSGNLSPEKRAILAGSTINPEGGVTLAIPTPYEEALKSQNLAKGRSEMEYNKARIDKLKAETSGSTNPLYQSYGQDATPTPNIPNNASNGGAIGSPDGSAGTIGFGTSYGYDGDKYGGPKAKASTVSAIGTPLDDMSLATSPDIDEMLKKQGYKRGDLITLHTSKGDVIRRWDDATATDAQAARLGLDPLRGRWDFHATKDNKPSPYMDAKIYGVAPHGATKPVDPNAPLLAAINPMAPTTAFAYPSKISLQPDVSGAVRAVPAPVLSPAEVVAADLAAPAAGEKLIPDGRGGFNVQNAVETRAGATDDPGSTAGGKLVSESGFLGGKVYQFPGFQKEVLKDGSVWMIPQHSKTPNQPEMKMLKKPDPADSQEAINIADAIEAGRESPIMTGLSRGMTNAVRSILAKRNFPISAAILDWDAMKTHLRTADSPGQMRMKQAIQNSYHSLDVIETLAEQWKGGKFPILNKANLALAKGGAMGQDAQSIATRLDAQIADVTGELANVYMGGNSPTNKSIELAAHNLSSNFSEQTMHDSLDQVRQNLQIRLNSLKTLPGSSGDKNRYDASSPAPATPADPAHGPVSATLGPAKPAAVATSIQATTQAAKDTLAAYNAGKYDADPNKKAQVESVLRSLKLIP